MAIVYRSPTPVNEKRRRREDKLVCRSKKDNLVRKDTQRRLTLLRKMGHSRRLEHENIPIHLAPVVCETEDLAAPPPPASRACLDPQHEWIVVAYLLPPPPPDPWLSRLLRPLLALWANSQTKA